MAVFFYYQKVFHGGWVGCKSIIRPGKARPGSVPETTGIRELTKDEEPLTLLELGLKYPPPALLPPPPENVNTEPTHD